MTTTEDLDLDAWIEDARLPEKSVTVYGRADLVAEHQRLVEELGHLQRASLSDGRVNDPTVDVATEIKDVEARMEASALTFRFRALTRNESKTITTEAPKDKDGEPDADYTAAAWLAASSVSPKLTVGQASSVREKIGEGQFNSLWQAAWSVSNDRRVDVPLSPAASVILSSRGS
jgi:hypothetical protein